MEQKGDIGGLILYMGKDYKLLGKDNKTYLSAIRGQYGGHKKLKIYGKLDCPSALRYIEKEKYVPYRVFFADEETALAAGYRPCAVCMKEHYRLWKEGKLMTHALNVTPILNRKAVCSVRLANGEEKYFCTDKLNDSKIREKIQEGIEYYRMKLEEDYCIITLLADSCQWGYTIIWDYDKDEVVHLTNTPYVVCSAVTGSQVIDMYLIQYWGHPADLWYSVAPVQMVDAEYEPDKILLTIPADESVTDIDSCQIVIEDGSVIFQAGKQRECIKQ